MKKKLIVIAVIVLLVIILFPVFKDKIKSTYYLYKYFTKYDRQQFGDVEGEGIYFNITKSEETVQTILGTSYWTENEKIKLLLLVQSLYKKTTTFQIYILLDYHLIDFISGGENSLKKEITLHRRQKKIYEIDINSIPDGAHDLVILIIPNTAREVIFSAHRTIFRNNHTYIGLPSAVEVKESNAENCFLHRKDQGLIFNFQKDNFENPESILLMLFDKKKFKSEIAYCNISDMPEKVEVLTDFDYTKLSNRDVQFILFTNPFVPSEYPPGKLTGHVHMTEQYRLSD